MNWGRAITASAGLVILIPCLVILSGGFMPQLPIVGRFGALIGSDLAWIVLGALLAAVLAMAGLLLGPNLMTKGLAAASIAVLAGAAVVCVSVLGAAGGQGATIDLSRLAGFGANSSTNGRSPQPDRTETFAKVGGERLRAEIWSARALGSGSRASDRASVVYVHGGGFSGGGLRSRPGLFRLLNDRGIAVIDVEYRLAPPPRWDQATPDVMCAMAWVAGQATELNLDPARIVLMGDSAGGNLVLMAAYSPDATAMTSSCGGTVPVPAGVVAVAPAADLTAIWRDDSISAGGSRFPEAYIGGTPSAFPDRYAAASPNTLIRPGLPPTLLIQGSIDHLVAPGLARALAIQLRAANVDCALLVIPFADHGFDGDPDGYGAQIEETVVPAFVAAHTGGPEWPGPACP